MNYVLTAEPLVLSVQIGAPKMTVSSAQSSMVATIRKLAPFSLLATVFVMEYSKELASESAKATVQLLKRLCGWLFDLLH